MSQPNAANERTRVAPAPAIPAATTAAPPPPAPVYYSAPSRPSPTGSWATALVLIALLGLGAFALWLFFGKGVVCQPCKSLITRHRGTRKPAKPIHRNRTPVVQTSAPAKPICTPTPKPPCETCLPQSGGGNNGFTEDAPVTRPTNNTFTEDAPVTRPADNRSRRTSSQDRSEHRSTSSSEQELRAAYEAGQQSRQQQQSGPSTKAVIADSLLQIGGNLAQAAIYRNGGGQYPNSQSGVVNNRYPAGDLVNLNCAIIGGCR